MLLVTGAAGFIGSNVVAGSTRPAGRHRRQRLPRIDGKWRNLGKRQIADFVPPKDLFAWLDHRKLEAVIHLGAISDTTATDGDL
jgi:ADP-L-glycero-D-manno-heptose 6-epimerase